MIIFARHTKGWRLSSKSFSLSCIILHIVTAVTNKMLTTCVWWGVICLVFFGQNASKLPLVVVFLNINGNFTLQSIAASIHNTTPNYFHNNSINSYSSKYTNCNTQNMMLTL